MERIKGRVVDAKREIIMACDIVRVPPAAAYNIAVTLRITKLNYVPNNQQPCLNHVPPGLLLTQQLFNCLCRLAGVQIPARRL